MVIFSLLLPVHAQAQENLSRPPVPILLYHHIDLRHGRWHVTPGTFEQELIYLSNNGYTALSMTAYADAVQKGRPLPAKPVVLTFDDGYDDAYITVFPLLKKYNMTGTFYVITGQVGRPGFLTWAQIREMHRAGMEFGGHTIHHVFLTNLSPQRAYAEILGSRLALEWHLRVPIKTFAYPFNDHNQRVVRYAGLAGFTTACIVDPHSGDSPLSLYKIPRITIVSGESMQVFEWVLQRI